MIKTIGIIGGGPAGLYCAWLLGRNGFSVTLFDHKIPFEKPCGGGITQKTFRDFPDLKFLIDYAQTIETFNFSTSRTNLKAEVSDNKLLHIISRKMLGRILLQKCIDCGVTHHSSRVVDISDKCLTTENGEKYIFDFIIGADGANGISRKKLTTIHYDRWGGIGFYIDGLNIPTAEIYFDIERVGYFWVFPRTDHASVGFIALKGKISKSDAERIVQEFLDKNYPNYSVDPNKYYAATIPLTRKFNSEDFLGNDFALLGDAAGLVDPITGEGIYYAFASAHFLAEALIENNLRLYPEKLNHEIIPELQKSADIFDRFYKSWLLMNMVRFGYHSPTISTILVRLIAGEQSYLTLKSTLIKKLPLVVYEIFKSVIFRKRR